MKLNQDTPMIEVHSAVHDAFQKIYVEYHTAERCTGDAADERRAQTMAKIIEHIGTPMFAVAVMMTASQEEWHIAQMMAIVDPRVARLQDINEDNLDAHTEALAGTYGKQDFAANLLHLASGVLLARCIHRFEKETNNG